MYDPPVTLKQWTVAVIAPLAGLMACDSASDVAPSTKTQIDKLANEHDCAGLQWWFDSTTNDAAGQLRYINDKMEDAGCYD
jgi:hypothetical protein